MKNIYLPADTKYLTNSGMKSLQDITENDLLGIITKEGELVYTKNFEVDRIKTDSLQLQTDGHYQTLLSTTNYEFNTFEKVFDEVDTEFPIVSFDGKDIESIPEDMCLFIAIFLNSYFKESHGKIISNGKGKDSTRFSLVKYLYSNYSLFFPYDRVAKLYTCPNTDLFLDNDKLELVLTRNIELIPNIAKICKDTHLAYTKAFSKMLFNSYKVANIFQVGLALCGYKTRLTFNNTEKMFEITYTNLEYLLNHKYDLDSTLSVLNEPVEACSIITDIPGKLIISQNIDKNTTVSLVDIS